MTGLFLGLITISKIKFKKIKKLLDRLKFFRYDKYRCFKPSKLLQLKRNQN